MRMLAAALVASGAFTADLRAPAAQWFRWKSGIVAPCGCNCRRLNTVPKMRRLVDDALADATRSSFPGADYIVAVAHAGIPWAKTVAERLDLPLAYVRAEARRPAARWWSVTRPRSPGRHHRGRGGQRRQHRPGHFGAAGRDRHGDRRGSVHRQLELPGDARPASARSVRCQLPAGHRECAAGGPGQHGRRRQLLRFYADPRRDGWNLAGGAPPPV